MSASSVINEFLTFLNCNVARRVKLALGTEHILSARNTSYLLHVLRTDKKEALCNDIWVFSVPLLVCPGCL